MDKLAEEIWKTTLCSLVVTTAIVGLVRYVDQDPWWRIPPKPYPEKFFDDSPLVYYSIENADEKGSPLAGLFFMNTLQQQVAGKYGVFDDVLPGQVLSLKISILNQATRSPSFRLQEREIRHLFFAYRDNGLEYLGSHSQRREPKYPKVLNLETEKLASANFVKAIENYRPIEAAEAKENEKKSIKDGRESRDNYIDNFPGNVNPLADRFPFYMFLHFR